MKKERLYIITYKKFAIGRANKEVMPPQLIKKNIYKKIRIIRYKCNRIILYFKGQFWSLNDRCRYILMHLMFLRIHRCTALAETRR